MPTSGLLGTGNDDSESSSGWSDDKHDDSSSASSGSGHDDDAPPPTLSSSAPAMAQTIATGRVEEDIEEEEYEDIRLKDPDLRTTDPAPSSKPLKTSSIPTMFVAYQDDDEDDEDDDDDYEEEVGDDDEDRKMPYEYTMPTKHASQPNIHDKAPAMPSKKASMPMITTADDDEEGDDQQQPPSLLTGGDRKSGVNRKLIFDKDNERSDDNLPEPSIDDPPQADHERHEAGSPPNKRWSLFNRSKDKDPVVEEANKPANEIDDDDVLNQTAETLPSDASPSPKRWSLFRRSRGDNETSNEERDVEVAEVPPDDEGSYYEEEVMEVSTRGADVPVAAIEPAFKSPEPKQNAWFGYGGRGASKQPATTYDDSHPIAVDDEEDFPLVQQQQVRASKKDRSAIPESHIVNMFCVFLTAAVVMLVGATIGTAYLGATLAIRNNNKAVSNTPPSLGNATTCDFGDAVLEFYIKFDALPTKVGIALQQSGAANSFLWDFQPRSFRSFALNQRSNRFEICLQPSDAYVFRIESTDDSGLVSTFVGTPMYGQWLLRYNGTEVASYTGDCSNSMGFASCGPYCDCQYTFSTNSSEGSCRTTCSTVAPAPAP